MFNHIQSSFLGCWGWSSRMLGWCSLMVSVMLVLPLPCCVAIRMICMLRANPDGCPGWRQQTKLLRAPCPQKWPSDSNGFAPLTGGSVGKCKICKAIIRYYTYKRRGLKHSFPWFSCSSWFINVHQFRVVFRTCHVLCQAVLVRVTTKRTLASAQAWPVQAIKELQHMKASHPFQGFLGSWKWC